MFLSQYLKSPLLLASCLVGLSGSLCTPDHHCKAYPGTPSWPSLDTWAHLNDTLNGQLIRPTPPAAACHPGQPNYAADQCPTIAKEWMGFDFHSASPVSVMWNNWANDTCLPDPKYPCSPSGYPAYVVNATTPQLVKAGVDFARKHNIRLVVKSTGHDYLGRSNAPGTLSIWTHHMNKITYHAKQFKLSGSGKVLSGNAVTVGGGAQMYDIYSATDKYNQTIVGGGGKTVGIGGYVTGGGHSALAPRYGLAADNALQMEVVTPRGDILTINEDCHSDLFWAMRGGGGSSFGVITSVTMKTHPSPKIQQVLYIYNTDPKLGFVQDLIAYITSQFPYLMNSGLSGYNEAGVGVTNPATLPGIPTEVSGVLGSIILQDNDSPDAIDEIFKPLNKTIEARWKGQVQFFKVLIPYSSFLAWFDNNYDMGIEGTDTYLVSRLMGHESLSGDPKALANALEAAYGASGSIGTYMVAGKGVQEAKPRGGGNAVNPAWRSAYLHTITGLSFSPLNNTAREEAAHKLNSAFEPLRKITPHSGAYINEALPFEKDWQHTFWGDHYERLCKIKHSVDPDDLLWCFPCVGNERWEEADNGQLCRVK